MGSRSQRLLAPADWIERPDLRTRTARVWQHAWQPNRYRCYVRMSEHCFGERLEHVIDFRPQYRNGIYRPTACPHPITFNRRGGVSIGGIDQQLVDFGVMGREWRTLLTIRDGLELKPQSSPIEDPTYHGLHIAGDLKPGVRFHARMSVKGYSSEIRIARAIQAEWASKLTDSEFFGFRYRMSGKPAPGWKLSKPVMYVERRGGTAVGTFVERDGYKYALFSRQQLERVLLPGDWIIDPAITRESVGADGGDCYELAGTCEISGYGAGNLDYIGSYGGSALACNTGEQFTTIPIPQGSAMNSASLRFFRVAITGTPGGAIFGDDKDNETNLWADGTGAQRPSGAGVTQTTASVAMTFGTANNAYFATNDIGTIVAEIVQRAGWASGNTLRFVQIENVAGNNFMAFRDFQNADSNEPEFDADYVDEGGGGTVNTLTTTDNTTIIDAAPRGITRGRAATDSLVVQELALGSATRGRIAADTLVISDGPGVQRTIGILADEDVSVADTELPFRIRNRFPLDTLTAEDTLLAFRRFFRMSTDNLTIIDSLVAQIVGGGGGIVNTVSATDFITTSDGLLVFRVRNRTATELVTAADAALRSIERNRTPTEQVVVVDEHNEFRLRMAMATDTVAVIDNVLIVKMLTRTLTDFLTATDDNVALYIPVSTFDVRGLIDSSQVQLVILSSEGVQADVGSYH